MNRFGIAALVALNVADFALTLAGFGLGYQEVGPLMGHVVSAWGVAGMLVVSVVGLAVEVAALWIVAATVRAGLPRGLNLAAYSVVLALAALPVASNLTLLF